MSRKYRPRPSQAKIDLARQFRRDPTEAEAKVWRLLRNRNCLGYKLRRQVVISGFIVDFYCPELRLVIELDGQVHEGRENQERDRFRDEALGLASVNVVRIRNSELS